MPGCTKVGGWEEGNSDWPRLLGFIMQQEEEEREEVGRNEGIYEDKKDRRRKK